MRRDAESIFESIAQDRRDIDPSAIRLIEDRVLIKDLGDLEQAGSIIIPQTARADS
ncbi:MAG: hypothetical protein K0Q71_2123, partial [Thermomicrobiales bacterium]|nr:hypothetical protein [Thermomicrobiales bacterium]